MAPLKTIERFFLLLDYHCRTLLNFRGLRTCFLLTMDQNGGWVWLSPEGVQRLPRRRHVLTVRRVEGFDVLTVLEEDSRHGGRVGSATLQLRLQNSAVERVDLVEVAEERLRPYPRLSQVGHRQLVAVIDLKIKQIKILTHVYRQDRNFYFIDSYSSSILCYLFWCPLLQNPLNIWILRAVGVKRINRQKSLLLSSHKSSRIENGRNDKKEGQKCDSPSLEATTWENVGYNSPSNSPFLSKISK